MKQEFEKNAKDLLRKEMCLILKEFSHNKDDVLTASIKLEQIVTSDTRYKKADTVLAYMSLPTEIQTGLIIEQALKDGKRVAIPKVINKKEIEFYYIDPAIPLIDQIQKGSFSIAEPLSNAEKFIIQNDGKQLLLLIPGIAFTSTGTRLGHGSGYYDRFLSKLYTTYEQNSLNSSNMPFITGLCYNFQIVPAIPSSNTDFPVDCIITDRSIITA